MNRTANRKNRNIHGEKTLFDVVSRKKSRVSLALAVSLWIATGGTPWAEAAFAANENEYYMIDYNVVHHTTGTTTETFSLEGVTAEADYDTKNMTITAEENAENPIDWGLTDNDTYYYPAYIYTVPSFLDSTEGYTLSVDGRNATVTGITNIRA